MSDQITKALLNKIMGLNRPTIVLYPVMDGSPAGGALSTPAGAGWAAAYTDLIGVGGLGAGIDFWLLQLQYDTIGAATELFDVQVYNLTLTTTIYEDKLDTAAVEANVGPTTFPFPVYCPAASQIQCRAGAAAATAIHISVLTAQGL